MKQTLFFLLLFCMFPFGLSQAQTKERGLFVEASVAYGDTRYDEFAVFTPAIGYKFDKRWSAGMKMEFETYDYGSTRYTPFVRFNFLNLNKWNLFAEAQYSWWKVTMDGGGPLKYSEAGVSFGATYALNKHLNLMGHYLFLGYSNADKETGAYLGKGDFTLDANLRRLQLGVQVIF